MLVSDWDLVTHRKSLFTLPAKTSVAAILQEYVTHAEKTDRARSGIVTEVMAGIKDFFDATAGIQVVLARILACVHLRKKTLFIFSFCTRRKSRSLAP